MLKTAWEPASVVSKEEIVQVSDQVLAQPDLPVNGREDIFEIRALELDWEIGSKVFEPTDPSKIAVGPDGKKVGVLLLHGGSSDHRAKEPMAEFLASKLGYKVAAMSFPGRLYLYNESHDWPGDTINPDGTVRTPIWHRDHPITPDQYELVKDRSDPVKRAKWGTLHFARAKEGTEFYDRLAAWPVAFEEGMKAVCARNFPPDEYSVYVHGHSTGGPFAHMILQRVDNIAGLLGAETSSFPFIFQRGIGLEWTHPFNYLNILSWRLLAMYAGPEAGPDGMWRLPWIMEDVFERWDRVKTQAQFKAEYLFCYAAMEQLAESARAAARRLRLGPEETEQLVQHYQGYARELSGPGVKPVPPILLSINKGSRDHRPDRYKNIVLPALAAMNPAPKVRLVEFQTGVHSYERPEDGLPRGVLPAIAKLWDDAIMNGYYTG